MFGEQLVGVFSSVSLSERWRLIISYLTEQWIAASLLTLLCQVNVPFFKWWREEGGGRGCIVDSEMMITHLTLCCCLPTAETNRGNKEISLQIILRRISSQQKKILSGHPTRKYLNAIQFEWLLIWKRNRRHNVKVLHIYFLAIHLQRGPTHALPLAQAGKPGKSVLGAWSAEARTRGFFPMNWSQVPALKVKGRGAGEVI